MNLMCYKTFKSSILIYSLLSIICLIQPRIFAQNITGIPIIENFSKNDYKASTQNWSICQGSEGYMYFGNNQGVLQYTGYDWQLVEMPNYSVVRCVTSCGKDSILIGAFNELGLLSHDNTGRPQFHSWNEKIPVEYRDYGEIWRIHVIGKFTYFQSFKSILIFKNGSFYKAIVPKNEYRFSYLIDNIIYIYERNLGLLKLLDDQPELIIGGDFFKNKEVWSLFKYNNQLLIGTQYNGFYTFQDGKAKVWDTQANQFVQKNTLFDGTTLNNNQFAFGTVMNGLIITDEQGKIKLTLNKQNGIQNNTILSLFVDKQNNIWIGLDNGIDYIKTNSPLSFVRKKGGFGTGYCSIVYKDFLYAGTNQGLFKISLNESITKVLEQDDFALIPGTAGQVWGLFNLNGFLLCGHNSGLFQIQGSESKQIFSNTGVWGITPIPKESNLFLMGTYYGFYLLKNIGNAFEVIRKISGLEESSRRFFFDNKGYLWMSHGYKGIYQLQLVDNYQSIKIIKIHNSSNDLPLDYNNEAFFIRNKVLAATEKGIYEFDYDNNSFLPDQKWDAIFNGDATKFTRLIEGSDKKIWAFKRGSIQLLTYINDKVFDLNTRAFLLINNTLAGSYENVLALEKNQYLLGTEDGFVLYNDDEPQIESDNIPLSIAWVESIRNDDQIDLGERVPIVNSKTNLLLDIPFRKRHLRIKLSMPYFASQDLVRFRYRVNKGDWGKWLNGNTLDLPGLTDDNYKIDIQCSIDEREVIGKTSIQFKIVPPIHRSWYAYLIYLLIISGVSYAVYSIIKIRIKHDKRRAFLIQRKKMIRQEIKLKQIAQDAENELNVLKNEKLQSDIIYKSKELANTTMDIIQKNIVLGDIKEALLDLVHDHPNLKDNNKINHLVKKINKGIEQKDKWIVFEKNFDQVHENFLLKLKEKHPDLTSKDMRLAAYIRMNLSSKEIAPLMNISVRSLEISRYRLRKKLDINRDQNLYDYLINI